MRIQRVATSAAILSFIALSGLSVQAQTSPSSPNTNGAPTSASVGTTPGQFSVSQSGAASYRIPIQVPPGVSGMAPQLELAYNSQRGNGMFGLGWGLAGLSAITRCGQTPGQDGNKGSVNFDANDRFCLDGQRLILVNGSYGVAGSEYRTEIDSFSKIVANGSAGNGPASFTIQTKAGLTLEYGNTTDSRVLALKSSASTANWLVGNVRTWAQNKATDQLGNYMTLSYDQDSTTGAYYPQRIDYTGNASSTPTLAPSASLRFVSDTTRLDTAPVYMAGAIFNGTKRINALRTYIGTTLVKEYRLAYASQSTSLDKSKLLSLTECEGTGVCLPPVALTWGSAGTNAFATSATALSGQFGTAQGWTNNTVHPRMQVDVNGDGLPDIVGFGPSGVYVALNKGDGTFAAPTPWLSSQYSPTQGWTNNSTYPRFLADVNGDGLPDIVGFGDSGVYVSINNGNGFNAPVNKLASQFGPTQSYADNNVNPRFLADVNGDGLPDIVGFANGNVYVSTNDGAGGFNAPTVWLTGQFGTAQGWTNNLTNPRYFVDVNGDGLPDIVGFGAVGMVVAINTGTSFSITGDIAANYSCPAGTTLSGSNCITSVAGTPTYSCLNGGGLGIDPYTGLPVCGGVTGGSHGQYINYPITATGISCPSGYSVAGSSCTMVSSAAIFFCPAGYTLSGSACSNGTGASPWALGQFSVAQGYVDNNVSPRYLTDINGDGLPDIVGFSNGGVTVAVNTGSGFLTPGSIPPVYSCSSGQTLSGGNCLKPTSMVPSYSCQNGGALWTDPYSGALSCSGKPYGNFDSTANYPMTVTYSCPSGTTGPTCLAVAGTASTSCPTGYTLSAGVCSNGTPSMWELNQFGSAQGFADNLTAPRYLVDVNADGLPDIVGFGTAGVTVSLNTGTTFAAPVSWNSAFGSSSAAGSWADNSTMPRFVVDVNGDGLPDIIGFSSSNVMVATNSQSSAPNFVASIATGTGANITPSYSALTAGKATNSSIYTKDSGAAAATFPKVDMAAPYYVVSSVAKSNGVGSNQTTNYTYGGLKFEAASGRGMLGFRWMKAHDQQTGIDRYSEYSQSWPTTGLPTLNETRLLGSGNADVLQRTVVTLGCQIPKSSAACTVAAGNTYFPYAAQTVESGWDLNGAAMPVTTSTYTYGQSPQFGDPTNIVVGTDDGASKTTANGYYPPDTTRWIVGRLQGATVISVKP